eukprot:214838_1
MLCTELSLDTLTIDVDHDISILLEHRRQLHEHARQQLCKFFQRGVCHKGNGCEFRHARWKRDTLCKHWLRGLCKKTEYDCEYLHEYDLAKMAPCQFFDIYGECHNPECLFLHQDKLQECAWYNRGLCKHGPFCRKKHIRRKYCSDFVAGFCPKGPDCQFGHPKFELPLSDHTEDGTKPKSVPPLLCFLCGSVGHKANQCSKAGGTGHSDDIIGNPVQKGNRNFSSVQCFKCGEYGHYANYCSTMKQRALMAENPSR